MTLKKVNANFSVLKSVLLYYKQYLFYCTKVSLVYFSVSNNDVYVAKTNNVTFPDDDNLNNQDLELSSELRSFFGAEIVKNKNISTNDNLIQALINQY